MKSKGKLIGLLLALGWANFVHAEEVTYVYTDVQGTPVMESNAQGNITARYDYRPYGAPVASMNTPSDGPGYTGHVSDADTGLVYMQARYYEPTTGRFLSTDPDPIQDGNVFRFNRFSYVNNNPVNGVDPTGKQVCGVYSCEVYNSGWNAVTSKGEARYVVNHIFQHSYNPDPANPDAAIPSKMPDSTTDALVNIILSPVGGRIASYALGKGETINLVWVDASIAFAPFGNEIWYNPSVGAYIYSRAESLLAGDGMASARLDVLLMHELGHTDLGHEALGVRALDDDQINSKEERRAVRMYENPYRASQSLPLRCSYFSEGDICH